MTETMIINPILVQAFHPDIPASPINNRLSDHAFDPRQQKAFEERLANQSKIGINHGGYVDLTQPDDTSKLSSEHHAAYDIARVVMASSASVIPYFLAETALHHDRLYEDLHPSFLGKTALMRVEEGLTWRAFETRQALERQLAVEKKLGKTYVRLPGFDSPVASAGWWRDTSEPDPVKRAEQCITDIPSCEVFMSSTIEDQAFLVDGGSVVRIVPSSMEDREASAVRILNFLGTYPGIRSLSSIIVNPGGDIKKIRNWGDQNLPHDIGELLGPMRVNDQIKRLTTTYSNRMRQLYASEFKQLPLQVRRYMSSPNDSAGTLLERLGKFQALPYPMYPLVEAIRPTTGTTASTLQSLREILGLSDNLTRSCWPHSQHYEGRGSNNVFHVQLPLFEGKLLNGDRGEINGQFFFSRVDDDQAAYLQSLPDIFRYSSHPFDDFLAHLRVEAHEPYYTLIEASRLRDFRAGRRL